MDISIIILNFKNRNLIKQQLKYFFSKPLTLRIEVIVVDNASHDGIAEMLKTEFPRVRYIALAENRGYAAGNSAGLTVASGTYCMIVNPDIVLTPLAVKTLFDFMEQRPSVGIIGPKLVNADGTLQYSCLRFPDLWLPLFRRTAFANSPWGKQWLNRYLMHEWGHDSPRDVDWLFGACLMVRRTAIKAVGLLDERFFLYMEDADWCRRFWERGWEVYYVPTVSVIHLLSRSSEGPLSSVIFNRSARIHIKSFLRYLWKYRGKKNPHVEHAAY